MLLVLVGGCGGSATPDRAEAQQRLSSASDAFERREYQQALEHYSAALELGGLSADQFVEANVRRAVCRAGVGDAAGAHADLDRLAADAPNVDLIYSARAFVYSVEGKASEAAGMLAKARALNRNVEMFDK